MAHPSGSHEPGQGLGRVSSPPPKDSPEDRHEQRFWLGQLCAGLAGYFCLGLGFLVYAGFTWTESNRGWMVGITLGVFASLPVVYGLRHRIVNARYHIWIFSAWNISTFVIIGLFSALDGGVSSPITCLVFLPMLSLAIGSPRLVVLLCGTAGLAIYGAMIGLGPGPVPYLTLMLQLLALGVAMCLAAVGAASRDTKERELRRLRQRLAAMAATDELTGCLNRRSFTQALKREVARSARYGHALSLLAIDVDDFKSVNDRHGHMTGDEVLREVGILLRRIARHADVAGRPGGDELALLVPETQREAARTLAERLRQLIAERPLPVATTLSIGVCTMVPEAWQSDTLRYRADQALYRAKRQGRDQVVVFEDGDAGDNA